MHSVRNSLLLLFLCGASLFSLGQTFSLSDTLFSEGDVYTSRNIRWELAKADLIEYSYPTLDSIVAFMNQNPSVQLEICVHMDGRYYRVQHMFSSKLIGPRAESIVNYLIAEGISEKRLTTKIEKLLLISDQEIEYMETREEQEEAHAYNRRVEFRIASAQN